VTEEAPHACFVARDDRGLCGHADTLLDVLENHAILVEDGKAVRIVIGVELVLTRAVLGR
jgi:hypothetical protein